jgi:hypothetical protein
MTSQEMVIELASFVNAAGMYLAAGNDEDKCIAKYAGYIEYQSNFWIKQLENGETLDIYKYTTIKDRMNDLLSKLANYLSNGELLSECEDPNWELIEKDLDKQEVKDYIYSQNGVLTP